MNFMVLFSLRFRISVKVSLKYIASLILKYEKDQAFRH